MLAALHRLSLSFLASLPLAAYAQTPAADASPAPAAKEASAPSAEAPPADLLPKPDEALGEKKAETYFLRLIEALKSDTSYKVRLQAAVFLGRSEDDRAFEPLVAALSRARPQRPVCRDR